MGTNSDQPAVPFLPPAPKPGVPPSGIATSRNIRGQANQAKHAVTARQQNFLAMMQNNTPEAETPVHKFANAAANLLVNQDVVDRYVDWVLFG